MTESTTHDFDPTSILNFKPSIEEASGERRLETPGLRSSCTIEKVDAYPPSETYPKEGSTARIKFTFSVDGKDETLIKRHDFYPVMKEGQKIYELLAAVWGADKIHEQELKALEGQKVSIYIKHASNKFKPGSKYADFNYDPVA